MAITFNSRTKVWSELSNFHPFGPDGNTVEAMYQSAKVEHLGGPLLAATIKATKDPRDAKRLGGKGECAKQMAKELGMSIKAVTARNCVLMATFEARAIMLKLLRIKFADPKMRDMLLSTGDKQLHEVGRGRKNPWIRSGKDWLGQLLMQVREEINNTLKEESGAKRRKI